MRFTTSQHGLYCRHWTRFANESKFGICDLIKEAHTVSHLCSCEHWEAIELEDKSVQIKKDGNFDNLMPEGSK